MSAPAAANVPALRIMSMARKGATWEARFEGFKIRLIRLCLAGTIIGIKPQCRRIKWGQMTAVGVIHHGLPHHGIGRQTVDFKILNTTTRTIGCTEQLRRAIAGITAIAFALVTCLAPMPASAQRGLPLIRDAEIEGLMRLYTRPIFKVAGIHPGVVDVHLVNSNSINAFVAGGQRIFIHTGLLLESKTPNEVIGVLAHETAHIAGGHLARLGIQVDKLTTASILTMLLGAAAIAGGAASGAKGAGKAGAAVAIGGPSIVRRQLLSYVRVQESASDQAAVRFLNRTGQSSKGMLELFYKLANRSIGSLQHIDPYAQSHPLPLDRIRNLERIAKASKHFNKKDPKALVLRHKLMQAKLIGFLKGSQAVYRKYPSSDKSLEGRYARAISAFRTGNIRTALPITDSLIKDMPKYPYFWELKGQALLENGQASKAIKPLRTAAKQLPNNGLIGIMLGQAYLNAGGGANAKAALKILKRARRSENDQPRLHVLMATAYGKLNNIAMAELETAEAAILLGDKKLAGQKIKRAMKGLKRGSPEWIRANDILNISRRKS